MRNVKLPQTTFPELFRLKLRPERAFRSEVDAQALANRGIEPKRGFGVFLQENARIVSSLANPLAREAEP